MGDVGHGLGATGHHDVGIASDDGLGAKDYGLNCGGADLVYGGCDGGFLEASTNGALAGGILAQAEDVSTGVKIEKKQRAYFAERTLPKKTS